MKANLKNRKESVRTWSRWIGGAALVLTLASPLVPTTSNAMIDIGEEVIEVEGEAPWSLPNWGGHTGEGASNGTPSGDMGGGGGGGGGGVFPSGGNTSNSSQAAAARIAKEKEFCEQDLAGTWDENVIFHDKGIKTNKQLIGYRCTSRVQGQTGLFYTHTFYDSRGNLNYSCNSSADYTNCPDGHKF